MKTIVVPTDFSTAANNALDYAVELAKFFNARIILVNAYPIPGANYEVGVSLEMVSVLRERAEENLHLLKNEIIKKQQRNFDIECITDMGSPFGVIDKVTRDNNADLIVVGIVGEAGKLKEHVIGSTAIELARNQDTATLIIPENVKYHPIYKISFACDFKKTEETDLVYVARYFAKIFDAQLEVISVDKPEEEITIEKAVTNMFVERKLEHVKHATVHVTGKDASTELENYFQSHQTDVVMLNPKKHNLFYYMFNKSITKELAFHAKLPILAIH